MRRSPKGGRDHDDAELADVADVADMAGTGQEPQRELPAAEDGDADGYGPEPEGGQALEPDAFEPEDQACSTAQLLLRTHSYSGWIPPAEVLDGYSPEERAIILDQVLSERKAEAEYRNRMLELVGQQEAGESERLAQQQRDQTALDKRAQLMTGVINAALVAAVIVCGALGISVAATSLVAAMTVVNLGVLFVDRRPRSKK